MRVRVALLLTLALTTAPLCAQTVRVWDAPLSEDALAAQPADVVALLTQAGYDVATITTDELLDPSLLTPDRVDLLVVSTLGSYPAEGNEVLAGYLRAGGRALLLGGLPFSRPLDSGPGGWQQVSIPTEPPGEVRVIADFDAAGPEVVAQGGEDGHFAVEIVGDEGGRMLRASLDDLQQWQYVDLPMTDTGDAGFSLLHFRIRGDAATTSIGLEMNEADGSRWKYVIPLTEEWQEHTIFIPHFLSYATEDRGDEGDYLHPERLETLSFGITRGMVGGGPHSFMLDDVERWQFEPPSRDVVPRRREIISATADAYGALVKLPPDQQNPLVALFDDAERFEGEALAAVAESGGVRRQSGWAIEVPTGSGPAYDRVIMSPSRTARVWPLLARNDGGTVAGIVQAHGGELAGATIGFLALDGSDLLAVPRLRSMALMMADYMARRPRVVDVEPEFTVVNGRAVMDATVHLAAPVDGCEAEVELAVAEGDGGPVVGDRTSVNLTGGMQTVELRVPADRFDVRDYQIVATVSGGSAGADRMAVRVDAMGMLTRVCDFFVEMQGPDGVITGPGFVDERAARALLAMYDMTGKRAYLNAAIRWGDNEIAMQREDGGYRMGYGITSRGEACYVADGGEIAIGMARLVGYVPAARRQAYLDSLQAYFDYRESFRLPDGTITVGWIFHEQFSQVGGEGTREAPFRSDKSFPWVGSCSLASTSAWQAITGRPEDREMAIADARWYLRDVPSAVSVSGEAAQWAHYFIDDAALRADLAQRMKATLLPSALNTRGWWYASGGRSAVTLSAVAYYYSQIEPAPEALAGMARGIYRMASPHSPASMDTVIGEGHPDGDEWRYLAYGAVGLAEVVEPLSTMREIAP